VVNIPRAAAINDVSLRPSLTAAAAIPWLTLSIGRNEPITPVDRTSAWSGSAPQASAAKRAISSASRSPRSPVQALATPEQIATARIRSLGVRLRSSATGAAKTRFFV
jgi:hypothetical protein